MYLNPKLIKKILDWAFGLYEPNPSEITLYNALPNVPKLYSLRFLA